MTYTRFKLQNQLTIVILGFHYAIMQCIWVDLSLKLSQFTVELTPTEIFDIIDETQELHSYLAK